MIRTLVLFVALRKLRKRSPELFDGRRARLAVEQAIQETLAESVTSVSL